MTESEAREKWCPMARVDPSEIKENYFSGSGNRLSNNENPAWSRCLAGDCAIWQWNGYSDSPGEEKGFCGLGRKG